MNKFFRIKELSLSMSDVESISGASIYKPINECVITSLGDIKSAKKGDIVYLDVYGATAELGREKYLKFISGLKASAVLIKKELLSLFDEKNDIAVFVSTSPKKSFISLQKHFIESIDDSEGFVISKNSIIDNTVEFSDKNQVSIGHFSIVGAGAKIGVGVRIGDNVKIGAGVEIGDYSVIEDGAVIKFATIGKRCLISSGAVIGSVGFGWASDAQGHIRIMHSGFVKIGDFVEIGCNTGIDRGTFNNTILKDGVKIDALCQIGHNVEIDTHSVIAGGCCIAGSVKIGKFVLVGGNTAIAGHISIEDGASIGGMSGVISNVSAGKSVWGLPAVDKRDYLKQTAVVRRLIKKKK